MADQLTPEQIAEIFEQYRKSQQSLEQAQEQFGKTLGRSAVQLTSSLYKGEKGVGQFGDAIESAATALQTLILAIPGLGIAAKLATVAIGLFAKGVNAAAKQGDALYKTYQDLSKAGATASDGITGVFRNMQNLGYGIEELDKMVALVTQNSETLAKFSNTAADGTNAFAQGMAQIQRDGQLRLLGKTTDDINAAGAAFIRQQIASGRTQKDVGDSLGTRTKAYVLELDRLQRLTGTSADALQKQQDEALSEDAYNDVMAELEKRAAEGDVAAQAQIKKITATMAHLSPEMQKEFQRSIGGDISAQSKLFQRMPSLMKNVMDESVSTAQTMKEGEQDINNFVNTFGRSYRYNAEGMRDFAGGLRDARETAIAFGKYDEASVAAGKQINVQDRATQALTEAQIANMNSRDAMQAFIQRGVAPATTALAGLAKVASGVTGAAAGAVGAPTGGAAAGSAPGMGRMNYSKELYGSAQAASGDVDRILATIRKRESGGNYSAQAKGSSASGAYQFIDSTWQSMTKKFGMGTEFASAKMAPKEIQDAVAKAYVQDILKRAGGDVSKVPLEWYTGNLQGTMSPAALQANRGLTAEMYQSKWMSEFQNQPGSTSQAAAEQPGWVSMLGDKLDSLNRTQRDQLSVQQKQLQAAS
jgi:hypothetical protein